MTHKEPIAATKMTDDQFREHALAILRRELGPRGVARFVRTFRPGTGDYTRDRNRWQAGITVPQIVEAIKKRRETAA